MNDIHNFKSILLFSVTELKTPILNRVIRNALRLKTIKVYATGKPGCILNRIQIPDCPKIEWMALIGEKDCNGDNKGMIQKQ